MLAQIPDIVALAALLLLLARLRQRYPDQQVGLWLCGLLLIFFQECAQSLISTLHGSWPSLMLVLTLDAYALAGSVFFWGAFATPGATPRQRLLLLASTPPLLVFLTLFGLGVTNHIPYYACIAAGLLTGLWTILRLRLRRTLLLTRFAVLTLMAVSVARHHLLLAAHLPLAYTYAICALCFFRQLPRYSIGRSVIATGFSVWSVSFLTHGWVLAHPSTYQIASEVWSLQPFAVTMGMLLVMFERQVDQNKHLALHDQLTSLPNRRLFEDRLHQAVLQAHRTGHRVALLVLDLDGFKAVNDTFGHPAGDALLCHVSQSMRRVLRSYNTVARLGGDEFAIVAPDLTPYPGQARAATDSIVASIQLSIAQPITFGEQDVVPRCSIGYAIYPDDSLDLDELHRIADLRMYQHKRSRRTEEITVRELQTTPVTL